MCTYEEDQIFQYLNVSVVYIRPYLLQRLKIICIKCICLDITEKINLDHIL